jgi:hypothetical protein
MTFIPPARESIPACSHRMSLCCLTMPVPMWPALSQICCTPWARRCWTIPHTAWTCYHMTSMHYVPLRKYYRPVDSVWIKISMPQCQWYVCLNVHEGYFQQSLCLFCQSLIMNDNLLASPSWYGVRHPSGTHDQCQLTTAIYTPDTRLSQNMQYKIW